MFEACLVLKVRLFSKLISLIYFNVFIEDFELLMLVSSLIYCFFLYGEIKFLLFFLNWLLFNLFCFKHTLRGFTY